MQLLHYSDARIANLNQSLFFELLNQQMYNSGAVQMSDGVAFATDGHDLQKGDCRNTDIDRKNRRMYIKKLQNQQQSKTELVFVTIFTLRPVAVSD